MNSNSYINDFAYDPVTAIEEKNAPKEISSIFADIKDLMGIPLVTSIWRGLASISTNEDLIKIWKLSKPIFQSGQPEYLYKKLFEQLCLPSPNRIDMFDINNNDLTSIDLDNIKNIILVYNRSNTMNLIALSALVETNFSYNNNIKPLKTTKLNIELPQLLEKQEISAETWKIIQQVNSYGTYHGIASHVATLWRHLGYWPNFLTLVNINFKPLNDNGLIEQSLEIVLNYIMQNGINLEPDLNNNSEINNETKNIITSYVRSKNQVIRMVALGNIMQNWINNIN